jgi:hypothetical protein
MKEFGLGTVPENLDEAKTKFDEMYGIDSLTSKSMFGILYCKVKLGEPFIKAYENTLKLFLEIEEKKENDIRR